jgi:NTP pyrophosphatase (non-canonical NTP hydrolase)
MDLVAAFQRVADERTRQDLLFPGKWKLADDKAMQLKRLAILTEELGEVARAILEEDEVNLTVELVQVAAVAVAWLEAR